MPTKIMDSSQKRFDCIIIGAGIAGLSAAHFLKKKGLSVVVLEKTEKPGGWLQTEEREGFLIERGPRFLREEETTAALCREMGLELLLQPKAARFLLQNRKLVKIGLLTMLRALPALLRKAPETDSDESVDSYCRRRFGDRLTETLIDPIALGIYGGDIKTLSIDSCFPQLKKGSLFKKSLRHFSLKGGMKTLVQALVKECAPVFNCPVEEFQFDEGYYKIAGYEAPVVIAAVPWQAAAKLMGVASSEKRISLDLVTFCFEKELFKDKGFGFLVPTKEKLPLLGAIFDSPRQVTFMMRPQEEPVLQAVSWLKEFLKVEETALHTVSTRVSEALPQYEVGFAAKKTAFESRLPPNFFLLGSSFTGVGVTECVKAAKALTDKIRKLTII